MLSRGGGGGKPGASGEALRLGGRTVHASGSNCAAVSGSLMQPVLSSTSRRGRRPSAVSTKGALTHPSGRWRAAHRARHEMKPITRAVPTRDDACARTQRAPREGLSPESYVVVWSAPSPARSTFHGGVIERLHNDVNCMRVSIVCICVCTAAQKARCGEESATSETRFVEPTVRHRVQRPGEHMFRHTAEAKACSCWRCPCRRGVASCP